MIAQIRVKEADSAREATVNERLARCRRHPAILGCINPLSSSSPPPALSNVTLRVRVRENIQSRLGDPFGRGTRATPTSSRIVDPIRTEYVRYGTENVCRFYENLRGQWRITETLNLIKD